MEQNLLTDDSEYVVTETGEIMIMETPDAEEMTPLNNLPEIRRMNWLARTLSRIEIESEAYEAAIKDEIERLKAIRDQYLERRAAAKEYLLKYGESYLDLMAQAGQAPTDKKGRPYIKTAEGRFTYRTPPASLDAETWEQCSPSTQRTMAEQYPEFIQVKEIVQPDKRKILEALKAGAFIEGFSINLKPDTFIFKKGE